MITKNDLLNATEAIAAGERQRLGEPPTADQMLAYSLGRLSPAEEAHVRELLIAHPDLAETLTVPFAEDDVAPDDPAYLSTAEIDARWMSMQASLQAGESNAASREAAAVLTPRRPAATETGRVLAFWRTAAALAAMLFLVFAGLFVRERSVAGSLAAQLSMPRMAGEAQLLYPQGRRGGGDNVATLTRDGDSYLLLASLMDAPQYAEYRVDLVDTSATPARIRWSSTTILRADLDNFAVLIPHTFLKPGRYEMVLYGISGSRSERLSSFAMRVPAP